MTDELHKAERLEQFRVRLAELCKSWKVELAGRGDVIAVYESTERDVLGYIVRSP